MTETPAPIRATRVSAGTQELRVATAMTGGVSLAIWMGGVARELNLLEQASRARVLLAQGDPLPAIDPPPTPAPVSATETEQQAAAAAQSLYLRLLDLMDVVVDVDMLSGTSAGGINAALLGFTRSRRVDLGILRDVWLETGSFETLLRNPADKSPPSLLYGDEVLLEGLREGIGRLARTPPSQAAVEGAPSPPTTKVFITTTLLTGETSRFADTYGTLVQDAEHRGLFNFDEGQLSDDNYQGALALAARCSASFPAAFEPAFVPCGAEADDRHPDMADFSNTTRPHFVADGGLLMNRPIKPLLEAIFDRAADCDVRRVLLYVVPSPGSAPDPQATPAAESLDHPYTFGGSLLKDLGAVLNQSIAAELRALRDHNDAVVGMSDTRLRVAELGSDMSGAPLLRPAALRDYRLRQSRALVQPIMTAFMRALTTRDATTLPESWSKALAPGSNAEADCVKHAAETVGNGWYASVPLPGNRADVASFGRSPLDGAKAIVIAILKLAWRLARSSEDRDKLACATHDAHESINPAPTLNLAREVASRLGPITKDSVGDLPTFAAKLATQIVGLDQATPAQIAQGWASLGNVLAKILPLLLELMQAPYPDGEDATRARADLQIYLAYFGQTGEIPSGSTVAPSPSLDLLVDRLFQLHVVTRAMLPTKVTVDQHVDLVQVSADTRSALTHHSLASEKLTGLQLHHFGAFYKSAWRANDWMWGRLDGAGWLVHLLLDPLRLKVVADAAAAPSGKQQWFLDEIAARIPGLAPIGSKARKELAYLDDNTKERPPSLPNVSMWIAASLQERIAITELPVVAREVVLNPTTRDSQWAVEVLKAAESADTVVATARATTNAVTTGDWSKAQKELRKLLATEPRPALDGPAKARLLAKLPTCPVPQEQLGDEVGEPLFTRTVTKAVAVTAAATAEAQEIPPVVKPALGVVRSMTLLAYRLAAVTRGNARLEAGAGAILALVGAFLLTTSRTLLGFTGVVILGAGVYLLLLVSWRKLHTWGDWVRRAIIGLVVVAAFALFLSDRFRAWLFDTPDSEHGIFSEHVLPTLRDTAWVAPLVLIILATLIAGIGWLIVKAFKKKKQQQQP